MKRIFLVMWVLIICLVFNGCGKNAKEHETQGRKLYKRGQYSRALAEYDKAITINPYSASAYFGKATIYELKGNIEEAINTYKTFIQYALPEEGPDIVKASEKIKELSRIKE